MSLGSFWERVGSIGLKKLGKSVAPSDYTHADAMAANHHSSLSITTQVAACFAETKSIDERVTTLYEVHRERIYRFLVAQGLDPGTAQDAAQDVFVDLYMALKKRREVRSELGWLYAVAGRTAVDYWRRERRAIRVELDADPAMAEKITAQECNPETETAERERLIRIADRLRRLSKEQRLCVHLRMQGLRYREIAKILEVSTSTAAEWISSAVDRLRGGVRD